MQLEAAAQLSVYRGITLTRKVQAFGTSEGAVKGWDTRGRGRKVAVPAKLEGKPPVVAPAPQVQAPVAQPATPEASGRDVQSIASKLSTSRIVDSVGVKDGSNKRTTRILTLADGSKAIFKPAEGMVIGTATNEIAASKVAQIVGLMDMAPVVVERTIDGKKGAMIEYQPGEVAENVPRKDRYDGKEDCGRALVFDYVIGSVDRTPGNWVVDTEHGNKLHLIDHGMSFPTEYGWSTSEMRPGVDSEASIPDSIIKPYKEAIPAIQQTLKGLGIEGKAIDGVVSRINSLFGTKKAKTWGNMLTGALLYDEL